MTRVRFALIVTTATGFVFAGWAGGLALSARDASSVISACVQIGNGSLRLLSPGDSCKKGESLVQWNSQGPQGPMGPTGPQGQPGPMGPMGPTGSSAPTGGTTASGYRIVDSTGTTVGDWQSPNYISLTVSGQIVFTALDLEGQSFATSNPPAVYYADGACATTPLMFLDMTHYGVVQNGILYYPTGSAVSKSYGSFNFGSGCQHSSGTGTFAAEAQTSVASFVAPFSIVH
jgi:hypothetical protein